MSSWGPGVRTDFPLERILFFLYIVPQERGLNYES